MARPRKPTAQLELEGAFKKNPRRRDRASEPVVAGGIGPPPRHINETAGAIWRRVAKGAYWLSDSDRDALEIVCVLKAEFETNPTGTPAARISILSKAMNDLGLTATARTRISTPKPSEQDENPWAEFMN